MTPPFDLSRYQDPLTIQRVIHSARTIAIVGLSKNQLRASYFVGFYLRRHGYRVIPVNPRETEIFGEKSFNSLADVPVPVDIVNVFRAPDALPGIAREAVAIGATTLWCQFTVINEEGGAHRRGGRPVGRHGSMHQGRARPLCRADALARLQHAAHHVRARRPASVGRIIASSRANRIRDNAVESHDAEQKRQRRKGADQPGRGTMERRRWQPVHPLSHRRLPLDHESGSNLANRGDQGREGSIVLPATYRDEAEADLIERNVRGGHCRRVRRTVLDIGNHPDDPSVRRACRSAPQTQWRWPSG